jgi:hypothetical protein
VIGGADSGDELSTMDWIPITDESRPVVQLIQDSIGFEWTLREQRIPDRRDGITMVPAHV